MKHAYNKDKTRSIASKRKQRGEISVVVSYFVKRIRFVLLYFTLRWNAYRWKFSKLKKGKVERAK